MQGWTAPQSGPASNRQDTRHSRLQTMLDAQQPDKLLAHLSCRANHRHEPRPLAVAWHRDQLLPMPAPASMVRRKFLTGIAALGATVVRSGRASEAQMTTARPHRIDVHHHHTPPPYLA